jgi:hypothetical protein
VYILKQKARASSFSSEERIMSITPYTIAIAQADLDDLQERLASVRWTNELPGVGNDSKRALARRKPRDFSPSS